MAYRRKPLWASQMGVLGDHYAVLVLRYRCHDVACGYVLVWYAVEPAKRRGLRGDNQGYEVMRMMRRCFPRERFDEQGAKRK